MTLEESVRKLCHLVEQEEERGFSTSEVTAAQLRYLELVRKLENPTVGEIAEALKVARPTATLSVERLATMGHLVKVKSDADRRSSHVHITESGRDLCRAHDAIHAEVARTVAMALSQEEAARLAELLEKALSQGTAE